MSMKSASILSCWLALGVAAFGSAAGAERIRSFETEIYLTAEDRFTVVERIG